jgi:hypothetical protein
MKARWSLWWQKIEAFIYSSVSYVVGEGEWAGSYPGRFSHRRASVGCVKRRRGFCGLLWRHILSIVRGNYAVCRLFLCRMLSRIIVSIIGVPSDFSVCDTLSPSHRPCTGTYIFLLSGRRWNATLHVYVGSDEVGPTRILCHFAPRLLHCLHCCLMYPRFRLNSFRLASHWGTNPPVLWLEYNIWFTPYCLDYTTLNSWGVLQFTSSEIFRCDQDYSL